MPGQVITFYSYKGGTGRSMALANVAVLLAQKPATRVLAMDWDLEAPGLERFFEGQLPTKRSDSPGVIDLLQRVKERVDSGEPPGDDERATVDRLDGLELEDLVHPVERLSSLHIMRAGEVEDRGYSTRIASFDWLALYDAAPYAFKILARVLSQRYSYVLVDSRTGLTDTSGVCTALLPEKLVAVFTPNRQSLDGAIERSEVAVEYRIRADDLRPLTVYPLASRVELSEDDLRQRWRRGDYGYQPRFEELFRKMYALDDCSLETYFDEVQIQHSTRHAYGESVATLAEDRVTDRLSLARSYRSFVRALDEAVAPWELRPSPDARRDEEAERARQVLPLLEREIRRQSRLSRGSRNLLFLGRASQLIIVGVAALLVFAVSVSLSREAIVIIGGFALLLIEFLIRATGATGWATRASLAESLQKEVSRYNARTRDYEHAEAPAALLAERTDDLIDAAEQAWKSHPLLLTPLREEREPDAGSVTISGAPPGR
jgi:eukaryotic-like serine/threonine-protein kinase